MNRGRREFLTGAALALAARPALASDYGSGWEAVRAAFALSGDTVHMSAMLLASHPAPVRAAIERHRQALDADPVTYLNENYAKLEAAAAESAGRYLGVEGSEIALTDSTTMGVGLVYNGLKVEAGEEILTTAQDYYVTHEALRLAALRSGATVRKIDLYDRAFDATEDGLVAKIVEAVMPSTRVVALTWVHSSTGLKLPIRRIADELQRLNAEREPGHRMLLCVDGVHGFGVEDETLESLGCDALMAGCHKWLFGPRGTGIVAARREAWAKLLPTVPSYSDREVFDAWLESRDPQGPTTAAALSPGGFKPFEHRWALPEAFAFHEAMGKPRVAQRTHELAGRLKEGLLSLDHVTLHTPRADTLSSGIVAFDVEGFSASQVVGVLRQRRIVASVAPYAVPHARLTPSARNTPAEIETALAALREIAGR